MSQIKKLPSVLAFTRAHFITDGAFYSLMKDNTEKPILVELQGIRGTQNISKENKDKDGNEVSREVTNLQRVEIAKSDIDAQAILVKFSLGFLDISKTLHSCNGKDLKEVMEFRVSLKNFLFRAKSNGAVDAIAQRYAINILNGRWLQRNNDFAKKVLITITHNDKELVSNYDTSKSSLIDFDKLEKNQDEINLANVFAEQLKGHDTSAVEITAKLIPKALGSFEVYPSQNYEESNKNDDAKTKVKKILFKLNNQGQTGLRDQKIFNSIKTIDTWYKHDYKGEIGPIPVEAYGSNIEWNLFLRTDKNSAFDFFKVLNTFDDAKKMTSDDALFILSIIERGGVFGESDKVATEGKKDKNKKDDNHDEGDA